MKKLNKVLITGVNGYIGSCLARFLKNTFNVSQIHGVDNNFDEHVNRYCNVLYNDSFENIDPTPYDAVFHLAAHSLITPSLLDPLRYYDNNVSKTCTFLRKFRPETSLIFASTAAVYKHDGNTSVNGDISPQTPYGFSKLMCEQMIKDSHIKNTVAFRFFNVAGAYMSSTGQNTNQPHVLTRLCEAYKHGKPFEVYGNDYNTPDGSCVRDFIHVNDVCTAMYTMASHFNNHEKSGKYTYNLGNGKGVSILELVDEFESLVGKLVNVKCIGQRPGDPAILVADTSEWFLPNSFSLSDIIESHWEYVKGK